MTAGDVASEVSSEPSTVASEVAEAIQACVDDTNRMWAEGSIAAQSRVRDVTDDLVAVQYAPHYDGGVWRVESGASWLADTALAAEALAGQGCSWTLHDLNVLARSESEAIAAYRIVHRWGDASRTPAQAWFLETWRRDVDGRWRLARHTAEKT